MEFLVLHRFEFKVAVLDLVEEQGKVVGLKVAVTEIFKAVGFVEDPEDIHKTELVAQGVEKFPVVEITVVGLLKVFIEWLEIYTVDHPF